MDLVTLITACALNVEPKLMHALIWKQSGGEPWSFSVPAESLPRVLPTLQDAVREAQATRPEGDRIRVGLTGVSINPRRPTAIMFAPCPNVTLAARQLTQLLDRCNTTSKPDPTHCAIAYRGSWDRPDIGFADTVRAIVEEGNAPNLNLPKDAYFDATDIASDIPTRKPHAAPSTPGSQPDDRTRGRSSALFPTRTRPNGTSAGKQNGRSSRAGTALPWSYSCGAGSQQGINRQSVCAEIIAAEAPMSLLALFREVSGVVARASEGLVVAKRRSEHGCDAEVTSTD